MNKIQSVYQTQVFTSSVNGTKLPLTNAQVREFFIQANQMAIPVPTVAQLVIEGINNVDNLAEFDETLFKQVVENLRRPSGVDANGAPNCPFTFGAKIQMRLLAAC